MKAEQGYQAQEPKKHINVAVVEKRSRVRWKVRLRDQMRSLNVVLRYRRYDIAKTKHDSIRDNGLELFKDLHEELIKEFKVDYGIGSAC